MAISNASLPFADVSEKFIAKGEGGEHAVSWIRGNRTQVTLSIAPDLLRQVDAIAKREHLSRAPLLTVWINEQIRRDASARSGEAA